MEVYLLSVSSYHGRKAVEREAVTLRLHSLSFIHYAQEFFQSIDEGATPSSYMMMNVKSVGVSGQKLLEIMARLKRRASIENCVFMKENFLKDLSGRQNT